MNHKKDSLGDRMKSYENQTRLYLDPKEHVIIRLDGRAFHTFTRGFKKPFDRILEVTMRKTMLYLCENIQNCAFGYTQSDEISLLLVNTKYDNTEPWFKNNIQKMVSVSASMATMAFNHYFWDEVCENFNPNDIDMTPYWSSRKFDKDDDDSGNPKYAMFDSRVFALPRNEVVNYFIWRQQDAIRNSKQAVGHTYFSQKQLHGKNCDQICEMLKTEKGIDWEDLPIYQQRGAAAAKHLYEYVRIKDEEARTFYRAKWEIDFMVPNFVEDREYVEVHCGRSKNEQEEWEKFWNDL